MDVLVSNCNTITTNHCFNNNDSNTIVKIVVIIFTSAVLLLFVDQVWEWYSKHIVEEHVETATKKERTIKVKERKEKLTEEEKDARKERKLGRKRERLEENSGTDHKRRRDVHNGDDDVRERDKYHPREKSPHIRDVRERSHEKFERDRSSRDDRQYGVAKSRSRIGY